MNQFWATVGYFIMWVYGIGAAIHTILFEWQFAVEHGPLAWFLFGWLVGALKGAIWPIFYII
jgi:hypothetical protein